MSAFESNDFEHYETEAMPIEIPDLIEKSEGEAKLLADELLDPLIIARFRKDLSLLIEDSKGKVLSLDISKVGIISGDGLLVIKDAMNFAESLKKNLLLINPKKTMEALLVRRGMEDCLELKVETGPEARSSVSSETREQFFRRFTDVSLHCPGDQAPISKPICLNRQLCSFEFCKSCANSIQAQKKETLRNKALQEHQAKDILTLRPSHSLFFEEFANDKIELVEETQPAITTAVQELLLPGGGQEQQLSPISPETENVESIDEPNPYMDVLELEIDIS